MEITNQFPELLVPDQAFRATSALFDGEIVCPQADGKPDFGNVIHRMQQTAPGGIERGWGLRMGEFFWQEPGATRAVKNIGTTPITIVEFELK